MRHEVYLYSLGHFCKCLTRLEIQSKRQADECFYAGQWNSGPPAAMLLPMPTHRILCLRHEAKTGWFHFETVQSCRVTRMPGSVTAKSSQWVPGVGFLSGVTCTQDRDQEILDECVDGDRARTHLGVRAKGTQMQGSLRPITLSYPKIRLVPHSLHPLPE